MATGPRALTVPTDLAEALDRDAEAKRIFDGLSYSHRREYVVWIEQAKRAETRAGRVAKTLAMLKEAGSGSRA